VSPLLKYRVNGIIGIHELCPAIANKHDAGHIGLRALGKDGSVIQSEERKQEYEFFHGWLIVQLKVGVSAKPDMLL
jgi:hypothetical protein